MFRFSDVRDTVCGDPAIVDVRMRAASKQLADRREEVLRCG
jgi:hypothetical protein